MQGPLKGVYEAFIAQWNLAPMIVNSSPNDHSTTNGNWVPESNSRPPNERSPTEWLLLYFEAIRRTWPPIAPDSWYRPGSSPGLGRVTFIFGQDIDELRNETPLDQLNGWTAQLDLVARDLPSMMRDGFFLTVENIRQGENHTKQTHTEGIGQLNLRCYTVASPTWSGSLNVCAATVRPVADFRLHHLSADKVFFVMALNHKSDQVYHYDARSPENNANYLYDDMPLDGLWPWPKKEGEEVKEEVEEGKQMMKGEGEGNGEAVKEGKEMTREEEGDKGKKRAERKEAGWEEETDCLSAWGSEDSLLGSWRD